MKRITSVLFDLGNVLAYIDFDAFWKSLGCLEQRQVQLFKNGYASWTARYEHGYIATGEYLEGLRSVFDGRFTQERLTEAFENIILDPVEGMSAIVEKVARTRRTGLVSNTNEIHYALSLRRFPVLKFLPQHYLSFRLHAMKPAKEFYDAILDDRMADASEILFIDDLAENIDGARAAGMQGLKFESPMRLEAHLHELGVIS
jgi:HAD superfamily hydrolase (TIGR01509 family)